MTSPTTSPTAYRSLSNTDDLIDTRDLQERLDALTALTERDAAEEQEYRQQQCRCASVLRTHVTAPS